MKVKPKKMAFEDSTATAPDRLTGQKNIVAFRAVSLKKGDSGTTNHHYNEKGIKLSDLSGNGAFLNIKLYFSRMERNRLQFW